MSGRPIPRRLSPIRHGPISPTSPIRHGPISPMSPRRLSPTSPTSPARLSPISPMSPRRLSPTSLNLHRLNSRYMSDRPIPKLKLSPRRLSPTRLNSIYMSKKPIKPIPIPKLKLNPINLKQLNLIPKSKSSDSISKSKSSDSIRTKHMKEIGLAFSIKNKYLRKEDITDIILRQYYNDTPYELINELQKIYPFKHEKYKIYPGYFGLNPRIHLLVPDIVKLIENDTKGYYDPEDPYKTKEQKLLHFYHNLAKNTSEKVIPYLEKIYIDDPNSDKLNWPNLCKNGNAIKILNEEYKKDPNKLVWSALCENPKAIEILTREYKKDENKIKWSVLCKNPGAIGIIKEEYEKDSNSTNIKWSALCENPKAIEILTKEYEKNSNKLDWDALCNNPKAIEILKKEYKKNPDSTNINWDILSGNPKAIELLTIKINKDKNLSKSPKNKINWEKLSSNPKAIKLLNTNTKKIWWNSLSGNTNPKAIELLEYRILTKVYGSNEKNHINWDILSGNPSAIKLIIDRLKIEQQHEHMGIHWHPDGIVGKRNINWPKLLANPSIFTINQGPPQLTEHEKLLQKQLLQIKRTTV